MIEVSAIRGAFERVAWRRSLAPKEEAAEPALIEHSLVNGEGDEVACLILPAEGGNVFGLCEYRSGFVKTLSLLVEDGAAEIDIRVGKVGLLMPHSREMYAAVLAAATDLLEGGVFGEVLSMTPYLQRKKLFSSVDTRVIVEGFLLSASMRQTILTALDCSAWHSVYLADHYRQDRARYRPSKSTQ